MNPKITLAALAALLAAAGKAAAGDPSACAALADNTDLEGACHPELLALRRPQPRRRPRWRS